MYRIRDWNEHFENSQSRRYSKLSWVPLPNKRGFGYTQLLKQKNGEAMFGCWCAIIETASTCQVRGELRSADHWFTAGDISDLTGFSKKTVEETLTFCSNSLDWIDIDGRSYSAPTLLLPHSERAIPDPPLASSIHFYSIPSEEEKKEHISIDRKSVV